VPISIAIVCEGSSDQRTGSCLADRVCCAEIDWLEEEILPHVRAWRGLDPKNAYLEWTAAARLSRTKRIPIGGFSGGPAAPDAHAARKALWLLHDSEHPPDAIVLLRDSDGDPHRRRGLEQARRSTSFRTPIVIGVADRNRECWVLAGFEPLDETEKNRLTEIEQEIGFDPRVVAHRLTGSRRSPKKDAKRVLAQLTGGDRDREAECCTGTDLSILEERGEKTGLVDYLAEIRTKLVPSVSASRRPS